MIKSIFLISGFAQHGKDSTANILKEKLNGKTLILHNADYLKYICSSYLGWNGEKTEYWRSELQNIGTEKTKIELKKYLFWTTIVCDTIEILQDKYEYFLIPDCRFVSEIHYPMARYPNLIKTIRVERLNFDNGLTEEQKNHISETELANYPHDFYIKSESGLDNLEKEINKILDKLI